MTSGTLEDFVDNPVYLEKLYAGILGKMIGVYLGRPFETWSSETIAERFGEIKYYVNEAMGVPLVVTDDDLSGTFTFIRALEDFGYRADLTAAQIGETWRNYLIEGRTTLWWGGRGNSTEHTAWTNLVAGMNAPESGAIATNGAIVAEQIGAQIFIDAWALVSPGNPIRAAQLARRAASVSHDGASADAAVLWASMEAQAFVTSDLEEILGAGLAQISPDSAIAGLVRQIVHWRSRYQNWRETHRLIKEHFGYDKFPGGCHVVPNHALMIMTILYAGNDFDLAQSIVNSAGWDTDCNAGNVGCLLGIMGGLSAFEGRYDWRGPIADRCLVSSAAGGEAVTDAVRLTYRLANIARLSAGQGKLAPPKGGAQFHFSMPGSVQGFSLDAASAKSATLENVDGSLAMVLEAAVTKVTVAATTATFLPLDPFHPRGYRLVSTPLINPGQRLFAKVFSPIENAGTFRIALRIVRYAANDQLIAEDGPFETASPGGELDLSWTVPDHGYPIASVGVVVETTGEAQAIVRVDRLGFDGAARLRLSRPKPRTSETSWRHAWMDAVSMISEHYPESYRITQNSGEGLLIYGTRDWCNYTLDLTLTPHLCSSAGAAVRVYNLRRFFAVRMTLGDGLELIRNWDGQVTILATAPLHFEFDRPYRVHITIVDDKLTASVNGVSLSVTLVDQDPRSGGFALMVADGTLSCDEVVISPAESG